MTRPDSIHIAVNGIEPAPQGSKRHVGGGRLIEVSKRCKPWREAVLTSALEQMKGQKQDLLLGPCSVSIVFRFRRPKAHLTTNGQLRAAAPTHYAVKKNDIDKICRSTLDALTDTVYADDSLVVSLIAEKRYCIGSEPPGALITVIPL